MEKKVTYVKGREVTKAVGETGKLRVAAYCRVSTDEIDQLNSFSSQVEYYTEKINRKSDWTMVGVYADEAVTGTKSNRPKFQEMIEDCLNGKIDLVLTKSISRFARNTVDTLNYVRKLKEKRVGIHFEEENINTLTMDGELLLTILSSVAQQEVQNISANVTKGKQMKAQRGEVNGNPQCYGYDYDQATKKLTLNPIESEAVKYIFESYSAGKGSFVIARELDKLGYPTPSGKPEWRSATILALIQNEKYKGDVLLGKTYVIDPISKKRAKNNGERYKCLIENHHDPIVSKELWDKCNDIFVERSRKNKEVTKNPSGFRRDLYPFSSKLECAYCKGHYSRKIENDTRNTLKACWKCLEQVKRGRVYCPNSRSISEDVLEKTFVLALNRIVKKDDSILNDFIDDVNSVVNKSDSANEIKKYNQIINAYSAKKQSLIDLLLDKVINNEDYEIKLVELNKKIDSARNELEKIEQSEIAKNRIASKLDDFKNNFLKQSEITHFDEDIFRKLVARAIIGGFQENGISNPLMITYVFGIEAEEEKGSSDGYIVIDSFLYERPTYIFQEQDDGSRKRVNLDGYTVKIALTIK